MRFKQFVSEVERDFYNKVTQFDIQDGIEAISYECGPFFTATGAIPLYRGMKMSDDTNKTIQAHEHPHDRVAKDSGAEFNFIFNAGIEAAFGIKDIRKHTLFCIGDHRHAGEFGKIFYVFPKEHFKFLWSQDVHDSYNNDYVIYGALQKHLARNGVRLGNETKLVDVLKRSTVHHMPPSEFLHNPAKAAPIIAATLKAYEPIGLKTLSDDKDYYDAFIKSLKSAFSELYTDDNLAAAIESDHEILIYDSEGYYTADASRIINYVKQQPNTKEGAYSLEGAYGYLLDEIYKVK